jgi:hypothetical protein
MSHELEHGPSYVGALNLDEIPEEKLRELQQAATASLNTLVSALATPAVKAALSETGVTNDAASAPLHGSDRNFADAFKNVLQPRPQLAEVTLGVSTAHNYTTPTIDLLPADYVIVPAADKTTYDWTAHTWNVLQQTETPREYLQNLWGNEKVHQDLLAAGRTRESVIAEQINEAITLGRGLHFLYNQERFERVRAMLLGIHPEQKTISQLPIDVTKKSFQAIFKALPPEVVINYANIGNAGDSMNFTMAAGVLQRMRVADPSVGPSHVLRSTQITLEDNPSGWMDYKYDPQTVYHPTTADAVAGLTSGISAYFQTRR